MSTADQPEPATTDAAPPAATREGERLAKRVAQQFSCSRSEAERYIEAGFVTVDGVVVDTPQTRVQTEHIELAANASLAPMQPVTLLLHKPPGYDAMQGPHPAAQCLVAANRFAADRSGMAMLSRHFLKLACVTPLETAASGLIVFTQDERIRRKLREEAALMEHETMVDVSGKVSPEALARLNETPIIDGRAMLSAKVSISRQTDAMTGLRFAVKGCYPGQIAQMCESAGLTISAMRRIRVGRLPVAGLPIGQWRYLLAYEKF